MTAIHVEHVTTTSGRLHLAFELGWGQWKLAFTTGHGRAARFRTITARKLARLLEEIALAKKKFALPADAHVVSCFEAGRDGFWLHRWLTAHGIDNVIVDSASIEVNRRQRRAKSDKLDAAKLLNHLLRYHGGEKDLWKVVNVPTSADEDLRQLGRELETVQGDRTTHVNRIKAFLAGKGIELTSVTAKFPQELDNLKPLDGSELGTDLRARLVREFERWQLADRQVHDLKNERRRRVRDEQTAHVNKIRKLLGLRGIGLAGSWILVYELFSWRNPKNRRQLGSMVGLTPTPYDSGESRREQGISKAGNTHVRRILVELAWYWLRWQKDSALSLWYQRRFAAGGSRARKVGIVALARKLLIALWRYLEFNELPPGAQRADWKSKVNKHKSEEAGASAEAGVTAA